MSRLIKNVQNRNIIEFDKGSFDHWCVYRTRKGQVRYAPNDTEYFSKLQQLGSVYGCAKIYNDFILFYAPAGKDIDNTVLDMITKVSENYGSDAEEVDIWFSVIYAGMIAEENKANAMFKKRVKRLGMHQVLLDGMSAEHAANFSKGKKWQVLHAITKRKGFQ